MADTPKQSSLWARFMGLDDREDAAPAAPAAEPASPVVDVVDEVAEPIDVVAEAMPVDDDVVSPEETVPLAEESEPIDGPPTIKVTTSAPIPAFALNPLEGVAMAMPVPFGTPITASLAAPITAPVAAPVAPAAMPVEALPPCAACGAVRKPNLAFCDDCGYFFNNAPAAAAAPVAAPVASEAMPAEAMPPMAAMAMPVPNGLPSSNLRIKDRYLLGQLLSEKLGVKRYRGLDAGAEPSVPVVIVAARLEEEAPVAEAVALPEDDFLPTFDADLGDFGTDTIPMADVPGASVFPRPAWEREILEKADSPALPAVVDSFVESGTEYLVLECPQGQLLWDAWDDPDGNAELRYGWLKQIAGAQDAVHKAGAIIECLSPDHLIVDDQKNVRFIEIGDLLPLPVPRNAPLRGNLYTPPEFLASLDSVDARASLYSFGAVLYSLEYLHHGLEEKDFESKYTPKQITDRFPDVHPLFPRLVNKTFVKDIHSRFPTDEAGRTDPTGFTELIQTLTVCQRVFDSVRLDVAAWTTTGMVRTGNEDAFAFLHGVDSRQDELYEYALVLLCDGMGGYDAGEVAAAMAIQKMKEFFLQQPMFSALAGKESFPGPVDVEGYKKIFDAALRHANKEVFTASRTPGKGKRGMGCTAEAVYVDPHHIFAGHVGDSRVYHLKDGRLLQLTRDQTLVNRLVELGQIKAEDAENHPRKNELQQAIGGQPDVHPGVYHSRLKRGDWVLVCSDGLSNHISNQELEKMLTREASNSAEEAARRLLNLVNLRGATDNATIVVIRAT